MKFFFLLSFITSEADINGYEQPIVQCAIRAYDVIKVRCNRDKGADQNSKAVLKN